MSSAAAPAQQAANPPQKNWITWAGWAVSLWPTFVVCTSATWKLTQSATYVAEFVRIGWSESTLPLLAFLQLGSLILFLIPRTSVLGAILLTGYLGGAVAAYTRIGEPYPILVPLSTAMIAWLGLFLRDERLRTLLPIRR